MDEYEAIERVKSFILANKKPAFFTTSRKELRVRCPYCGDSRKDASHAHLYIEMKPPFRFYCQKCNTGGVLNAKTMRDFQLYDTEIAVSLTELNKNYQSKKGYSVTTFKKKEFEFPIVVSSSSTTSVNYFNSRYGTNFSNEEITNRFKAVTDGIAFFEKNNLQIPYQMYDISRAIGFLSSDNSHIIFRDTSGTQSRRYFNYAIYPDEFGVNKFYSIKTEIDMLTPEIDLVLCEGIFDIIGVYNYFYNQNKNIIFAAACGKGYNSVIANFIHKGFLNLNITIYSDGDVPLDFYRNLKMNSPYLKRTPITIFYNELEKDYGVPLERIKLRKSIL